MSPQTCNIQMWPRCLLVWVRPPTVIVGSLLKSGTNFVGGTSNLFVVEACEYRRSFLNLSPEILVITNIDNDHLDYYGTIEGVQKAFTEMVGKVPPRGAIVCDPNDTRVAPVLLNAKARIVDYTKENLDVVLAVSGEHNIKNAKAVLSVMRVLGVDRGEAEHFLKEFQGTWRRMEYKGETKGGTPVYDDYAHPQKYDFQVDLGLVARPAPLRDTLTPQAPLLRRGRGVKRRSRSPQLPQMRTDCACHRIEAVPAAQAGVSTGSSVSAGRPDRFLRRLQRHVDAAAQRSVVLRRALRLQ